MNSQRYATYRKYLTTAKPPTSWYYTTSLRPTSIRLVIWVASILYLRLFAHYITQAYLQRKEPYSPEAHLKQKSGDRKLFDVNSDEFLQLHKPVYGLFDSGKYWIKTIEEHFRDDQRMDPSLLDSSLYARWKFDWHNSKLRRRKPERRYNKIRGTGYTDAR